MRLAFTVVLPSGERALEDLVPFEVDLTAAPDEQARAELRELYEGWVQRIKRAARKEAKEDGSDAKEAVDMLRFEPCTLRGRALRGGVARAVNVHTACAWAISALRKRKDVAAVRFSYEDDESVERRATPVAPTTNEEAISKDHAALELSLNGDPVATLTFGMTFTLSRPISELRTQVLALQQRFFRLIGPARFTHWGDENTRGYFRPVQKATLGLLEKWLAQDAVPRTWVHLVLKDGTREGAPRFRFELHSRENDDATGLRYVHMSVPATWAMAHLSELEALVRTTAAALPFAMGAAGLGFDCSLHEDEAAESHAHAAALSHPALSVFVDRVWMTRDKITVGGGFPGVRWLTLLGPDALVRVKKSSLSALPGVEYGPLGHGVLLKAGTAPTLDGAELGAVSAALAPLLRSVIEGSMWLKLSGDCDAAQMFVHFTRHLGWPQLLPLSAATEAAMRLRAARISEDIERRMPAVVASLDGLAALEAKGALDSSGILALGLATLRTTLHGEIELALRKAADREAAARMRQTLLGRADAPDALFAQLRVRQEPSYVFSGALQDALDADDLTAAAALAELARPRAKSSAAIAHALARVYARLGRLEEGAEMMTLASRPDYEDAKHLKSDAQLAPLHARARRR